MSLVSVATKSMYSTCRSAYTILPFGNSYTKRLTSVTSMIQSSAPIERTMRRPTKRKATMVMAMPVVAQNSAKADVPRSMSPPSGTGSESMVNMKWDGCYVMAKGSALPLCFQLASNLRTDRGGGVRLLYTASDENEADSRGRLKTLDRERF